MQLREREQAGQERQPEVERARIDDERAKQLFDKLIPPEARVVDAAVPSLIDELPALAVAQAFARGVSEVRGAAELRVKETDRIATVVDGLRGLGASIEATGDARRVQLVPASACSSFTVPVVAPGRPAAAGEA